MNPCCDITSTRRPSTYHAPEESESASEEENPRTETETETESERSLFHDLTNGEDSPEEPDQESPEELSPNNQASSSKSE